MAIKKCEVCGEESKALHLHMRKHAKTNAEGSTIRSNESSYPEPIPVYHGLEEKMDAVVSGLNSVSGALAKLIELQTVSKIIQVPAAEVKTGGQGSKVKSDFNPKLDDETYPGGYMPPKFRKIVDELLSKDFGATVIDFDDRTDFQFNIIVPERYSSVPAIDRAKGVEDVRSRLIPRALGENGVKDWCTLIRRNLNKFYQKEGVASPFGTAIN